MEMISRYHNYDLHPTIRVKGCGTCAWEGQTEIAGEIRRRIAEISAPGKRVTVCMDAYPGVETKELLDLARELDPVKVLDMEQCAKSEETLNQEFEDYLTEDRVFGVMCHKDLRTLFREEKLRQAEQAIGAVPEGTVVIVGLGAGLLCEGDVWIWCSLTRWEAQLRYRAGRPNWHCTNTDAPVLAKYKRGFFVEWRLADRYKKARYEKFDYVLDTEEKDRPKMAAGDAYREALRQVSRRPFRMEPYFDPGVWGGKWMQRNFGLDPEQPNFAWSFDGVPEENALNLKFGETVLKVPALDLVLYCPHELLGERVHARFGAEFPIRFDLLDTMGGGNLSLQVHPLTEYIQDTFGMHYTQDESYYLLDTDETEETFVYLGVKKGVNPAEMERDLRAAQRGDCEFPADKYVNKVPVKKHDHILIPAGTVHCSGKNTMVLEISATPYIFTFKLWDWGRLGTDGLPRPIHIDHGMKNIQWDRDTDWIYENLTGQAETLAEGAGYQVERTGLHSREFIDTYRYTLIEAYTARTGDSVHVINLVEGKCARIESPDGSFEPFEIHYAETAVIPASVKEYRMVPEQGCTVRIIDASVRKA